MAKEINPLVIASCPKEGPTITDCTISAEAGSLPARSTLAKSCASATVKLPRGNCRSGVYSVVQSDGDISSLGKYFSGEVFP